MEKKITIVYYAFINPKSVWWNIIGGQLSQLKQTGIEEIADMYIHISGPQIHINSAINKIKPILPNSVISYSTINQYEYRGIHLIWSLAKKRPDHIYLYFHTKGMSHNSKNRTPQEVKLFQSVIMPWNKILNIFKVNENINKIGLAAGIEGWMWFNFWWARGRYLKECEEPVITTDRYYYEGWLGKKIKYFNKSNIHECYSLVDNKYSIYYTPKEACKKLNNII